MLTITNTVAHLADGNLTERTPETSQGEIGQLERGVNRMAGALEENRNNLTIKVRDATSELLGQKLAAEAAVLAKSRFLAAAIAGADCVFAGPIGCDSDAAYLKETVAGFPTVAARWIEMPHPTDHSSIWVAGSGENMILSSARCAHALRHSSMWQASSSPSPRHAAFA